MANADAPPRISTCLMYFGICAFFASMVIGSIVGEASQSGYGGAVVVLGILLLGAAAFVMLSLPAAAVSFAAARRDPGNDTHGAILGRWFVLATAVIGIVLYAKHLA
jgi:hypothetical protein